MLQICLWGRLRIPTYGRITHHNILPPTTWNIALQFLYQVRVVFERKIYLFFGNFANIDFQFIRSKCIHERQKIMWIYLHTINKNDVIPHMNFILISNHLLGSLNDVIELRFCFNELTSTLLDYFFSNL